MKRLLGTWLAAVTVLESGNERQFVQNNSLFSVFLLCSFRTKTRHFALVTGRKSSNQCLKLNLDLLMFKSMLHCRNFAVGWYIDRCENSLVNKCSIFYFEWQVTLAPFCVTSKICNLNFSSGTAVWIPHIWGLNIKMSINVHILSWCEKNIRIHSTFTLLQYSCLCQLHCCAVCMSVSDCTTGGPSLQTVPFIVIAMRIWNIVFDSLI